MISNGYDIVGMISCYRRFHMALSLDHPRVKQTFDITVVAIKRKSRFGSAHFGYAEDLRAEGSPKSLFLEFAFQLFGTLGAAVCLITSLQLVIEKELFIPRTNLSRWHFINLRQCFQNRILLRKTFVKSANEIGSLSCTCSKKQL